MNKIANRISELRKGKGLTQKQMADKLAMTQVGYSKIETGKTELTFTRLEKISEILEIDLRSLLFPDEMKEADRIKFLGLFALDRFESNQIFLKQFEYNLDDEKERAQFDEEKEILRKFKMGVVGTMINVDFCSEEDIKSYREWLRKTRKEKNNQNNVEETL